MLLCLSSGPCRVLQELEQAPRGEPLEAALDHVDWDGSEAQNNIATDNVTGVAGNPVTKPAGEE